MRKSPFQFSGLGSTDAKLWLSRGYAILDGPSLPIIEEGGKEANDTYVEQVRDECLQVLDDKKLSIILCGRHFLSIF